ncbi:hypothetical protein ABZ570_21720 [Micromonospora sp. NPDC007271]|uniref:hypothetical protein n=1 Tax=Micromonospora sp. NPDC007271 TaxID=3154587 RepID=UPI0033D86613
MNSDVDDVLAGGGQQLRDAPPQPRAPSTAKRRCGQRAAQSVSVLYAAAALVVIRLVDSRRPVSSRATAVKRDLCGSMSIVTTESRVPSAKRTRITVAAPPAAMHTSPPGAADEQVAQRVALWLGSEPLRGLAMTEGAIEAVNGGDDDADRKAVEREHAEMQDFAAGLSRDELHSGSWFTKLVVQAVSLYTQNVDWQYLQRKYPGATADIKVDQRIKMATRYASLAGGLFASAYSVAFLKGLSPEWTSCRSWS